MRELNLTQSALTKALVQLRESNAKRIKKVRLAIGEISEIDRTAIQKHWDELSHGTPAERAEVQFRSINAEVQCMACFQKYHPLDRKILCPYCGSYGAKILSGEEFYLESVEFDVE